MKKYITLILLGLIVLSFSGCTRTAKPNLVAGRYYMAGDNNCVRYRNGSASQITCINDKGQETGIRYPMSDQEISMYQHNQQMAQQSSAQFQQSMQNLSNQMQRNTDRMNYNTQQMLNRNNTYKVKIKPYYGY